MAEPTVLKSTPNDRFFVVFEKLFLAVFCQKSAERKSRRNIFQILFWCLAWGSNPGFMSNNNTLSTRPRRLCIIVIYFIQSYFDLPSQHVIKTLLNWWIVINMSFEENNDLTRKVQRTVIGLLTLQKIFLSTVTYPWQFLQPSHYSSLCSVQA